MTFKRRIRSEFMEKKNDLQKKYILPILLIGALATGGLLLMIQGGDAVTAAAKEKTGLLTSDMVNASFQGVGGRVSSVEVVEQQDVKAGDVIMQLDTTDMDIQIAQLKGNIDQQNIKIQQSRIAEVRPEELTKQELTVASAKEALQQAQQNYDRCKALYDENALAKKDFEGAASQLELAKNTLALQQAQARKIAAQNSTDAQNNEYSGNLLELQKKNLESQLEALELQRERMTLKAPIDGKIAKLIPKAGENIAAGAVAATIQANDLYYSIYVNEKQISEFQKGDTITAAVPALKEKIKGTIRSISSAPQYAGQRMSRDKGQSDTSAYLLVIDIKASQRLLPGMTVEVDLDE